MEGHGILRAQKSTNPGSGRKEMCSPADNLILIKYTGKLIRVDRDVLRSE